MSVIEIVDSLPECRSGGPHRSEGDGYDGAAWSVCRYMAPWRHIRREEAD